MERIFVPTRTEKVLLSIDAVAKALLEKEVLTGKEVREIVKEVSRSISERESP